jgi:hypothetical protein
MDGHLEGVGSWEIDTIVGSLGAAFSMGDPKLTALCARMAALERRSRSARRGPTYRPPISGNPSQGGQRAGREEPAGCRCLLWPFKP